MSDNPHEGHRKRLKKEILEHDFSDSIPEHKLLEVLLFYGIPRKDTNPIAHALIDKFGSLKGVFEASPCDLFEVSGMTEHSVTLIKLVTPLVRKIYSEKPEKRYKFTSIDEFGEHIVKKYFGYGTEVFMLSCFDDLGGLINETIIARGDADNVSLSVKNIMKAVLVNNPATVIISHNHVNSPAVPSMADLEMTESLKFTLEQINVKLIDHIIVSGNDYVSIKQSAGYNSIL